MWMGVEVRSEGCVRVSERVGVVDETDEDRTRQ